MIMSVQRRFLRDYLCSKLGLIQKIIEYKESFLKFSLEHIDHIGCNTIAMILPSGSKHVKRFNSPIIKKWLLLLSQRICKLEISCFRGQSSIDVTRILVIRN